MPLDLTGQTTGEGLASQFGYGSEYGQYFSPMQEGLLESGTQAGWSGYRQAKEGEIGKTFGLKSRGLLQGGRSSLLDLTRQRQAGHGGFAGSGAAGREYGRSRSQLTEGLLGGMSALRTQRGASMFGVEQDILSKIGAAQGRIEDWRQGQIGIGLRLAEMGATKGDSRGITDDDYRPEEEKQLGFPQNPYPNQIFTASNGITYIFDDIDGWKVSTSQESPSVTQPNTVKDPVFTTPDPSIGRSGP